MRSAPEAARPAELGNVPRVHERGAQVPSPFPAGTELTHILGPEIRCFFRDPAGHLLELSQAK